MELQASACAVHSFVVLGRLLAGHGVQGAADRGERGYLGPIYSSALSLIPRRLHSSNRMQRSPLLDQVQAFLPQMAQANEKLRKETATAPADGFTIENIDGTSGNTIQTDVALFEMNRSDSKEEDSSEESSQDSSEDSSESEDEDCIPSEVTIDNIKILNTKDGRGKIEVLDSPASKKKRSSEIGQ